MYELTFNYLAFTNMWETKELIYVCVCYQVKIAATNALLNSLEFTRGNFEKDAERHFLMQVVCEATQSPDVQVP